MNNTTVMNKKVFSKTPVLSDKPFSYCPGCTHGIIQRLIAEVMEELSICEETIGVGPVGCALSLWDYWRIDMQGAAHGRAPAVATGIKRVQPDKMVFTYQGDGDVIAIGTAEIIHAAARGEKITCIMVNNCNFGMTGGQHSPTTLVTQRTQTTAAGRDPEVFGYPIRVAELLAQLDGTCYSVRTASHKPAQVKKTKRAIKRAFELQKARKGFTFVEVLSTCPVNWGVTPLAAVDWLEGNMIKHFPLGVFKDTTG
jgi:2-oxoglutarate ferredoxin oxidoreductase subunit beta